MAIRQLMLSKKIEQRKSSLVELQTQQEGLTTRSADLEKALEEAKTDEEIAAVEEEADKLDAEQSELDEKKGKLEGEIAGLESELEKLKMIQYQQNLQEMKEVKLYMLKEMKEQWLEENFSVEWQEKLWTN